MKKTADYFDEGAEKYDEKTYLGKGFYYPANFYRAEIVKKIISRIPSGRFLDAGCGTGQILAYLVKKGYDCVGCDFSENMLKKAQENISKVSSKEIPLIHTSIDKLDMFENNYFDHVLCLGVLPYVPDDEESQCYRELHRVIKPDGYLITAHENEIFDVFTFNKYTLRFFERNIYPLILEVAKDANLEELKNQLSTLIKNPDKPESVDFKKSGRAGVFTKPENPITYPDKLQKYGFTNKENYYYHFHALPPLICNDNQELIEISKNMEICFSQKWQSIFLASTFISVAQANK